MQASTYHLDQNVRGAISKGHIDQSFLDNDYRIEAILPFSVLEYAGINIKKIFLKIPAPGFIITKKPLDLTELKNYFDSEIKEKLPKEEIEEKIKEKLQYENEYAKPFIKECIRNLSEPYLYSQIVNQLSWDRFSQMEWGRNMSETLLKNIRKEIARYIAKYNDLYFLRHSKYLSELVKIEQFNWNEEPKSLMKDNQETKIKPNMDIGDCELIHIAINGQSSGNSQKKRIVDCYTMDDPKEIKRRLALCIYYHELFKHAPIDYEYKFDLTHSGKIYIIDERGRTKEKIQVKDYATRSVLLKKKLKNLVHNTLFIE